MLSQIIRKVVDTCELQPATPPNNQHTRHVEGLLWYTCSSAPHGSEFKAANSLTKNLGRKNLGRKYDFLVNP